MATEKKVKYSVVIPVYNEDGNVKILHEEIVAVMNSLGSYEIIYINDGSTDITMSELRKLRGVTIIDLNRNYGQSTALDAGFKHAKGEIIISMDGDLQNDPKDILKLLKKLESDNLDVVCGWRKKRKDKNGVKVLTKIGRALRKFMIKDDVHDTGCTLRVYRAKAAKSLDISGEMHRYILALLRWKGFKIGEVEVNHRPRINGKTKYGYGKAIRGFIDLIYIWFIDKYSQRPLHIFGSIGIFSFLIGISAFIYSICEKLFFGLSLNRSGWFLLGTFLIIAGLMAFSFGIVIDLLMKIHLNSSPYERRYYIREIIER
ncbi:MAG: glycosyltransferase family 2 protein [Candidatus Pacearchaeota archaeon]